MKTSVAVRFYVSCLIPYIPQLYCYEANPVNDIKSGDPHDEEIKPNDLDDVISHSEEMVLKLEDSDAQRIWKGRYIDPRQVSAEARHQLGSLPEDLQYDLNFAQTILENAAVNLSKRYSLSKREIFRLPSISFSVDSVKQALKECADNRKVKCKDSKYRAFDGRCNNLFRPNEGRTNTCHRRMIPPDYGDGIQEPRQSAIGEPLPSPRLVTISLTKGHCPSKSTKSVFFVGFGQFIDHDIAMTAQSVGANRSLIQCCPKAEDDHPECLPIHLSEDDPEFPNRTCINFVRAQKCTSCSLGRREQMNTVTPVIDCSQVYGTSSKKAKSLRMKDGTGKMKVRRIKGLGDILPPNPDPKTDQCSEGKFVCFDTGDSRANQHPILQVLHTISVRFHNYIVDRLKAFNPQWSPGKLYQEARRIVIAVFQHITYCHYVPIVVGEKLAKTFHLCDDGTKYWMSIPATLFNSVATAALRFAHSTVPDNIEALLLSGKKISLPFKDYFFNTKPIYRGLLEDIIRGISKQTQYDFDSCMADSVTDFLYRERSKSFGLDLSSINIQRGRDHGVPGFSAFHEHIFGLPLLTFVDLTTVARIQKECAEKLKEIYKSVHDIDLFVGLLCETPLSDAVLGRMGAHMVAKQFYSLKYGDRYFYTHKGQAGSFTEDQRKAIRRTTISTVICAVTKISEISKNVMDVMSPVVSCDQIPKLDLRPWRN